MIALFSLALSAFSFRWYFYHDVDNEISFLVIGLNGLFMLATFAFIHLACGLVFAGGEKVPNGYAPSIADAIYFSVVTFTTLGYGDFQPTEKLRLFSAIQALSGYMFLGATVAIVHDAAAIAREKSANHRGDAARGHSGAACAPADAESPARGGAHRKSEKRGAES